MVKGVSPKWSLGIGNPELAPKFYWLVRALAPFSFCALLSSAHPQGCCMFQDGCLNIVHHVSIPGSGWDSKGDKSTPASWVSSFWATCLKFCHTSTHLFLSGKCLTAEYIGSRHRRKHPWQPCYLPSEDPPHGHRMPNTDSNHLLPPFGDCCPEASSTTLSHSSKVP